MNHTKTRLVACPTCKTLTEFSANNHFRPFCSERCTLMDLGAWASERFAIPVNTPSELLSDDLIQ
ncbi:MAG: DNA gyrase inhibitor YacG [Methylotenera sp.]|nr:DNA gyrase inhibitor YacG [Methylotenera sp.]